MWAGKGRSRRCRKRKTKEEEEAEEEEDVCLLATLLITKQQHTALIICVILRAETLKSCHCTFNTRFAGLCRWRKECTDLVESTRGSAPTVAKPGDSWPKFRTCQKYIQCLPQQLHSKWRRATKSEFSPIPKWVVWLRNQIRNWLKLYSVPG